MEYEVLYIGQYVNHKIFKEAWWQTITKKERNTKNIKF